MPLGLLSGLTRLSDLSFFLLDNTIPLLQREFASKFLPDDPMFKVVSNLYEVVPDVLGKMGKVGDRRQGSAQAGSEFVAMEYIL